MRAAQLTEMIALDDGLVPRVHLPHIKALALHRGLDHPSPLLMVIFDVCLNLGLAAHGLFAPILASLEEELGLFATDKLAVLLPRRCSGSGILSLARVERDVCGGLSSAFRANLDFVTHVLRMLEIRVA